MRGLRVSSGERRQQHPSFTRIASHRHLRPYSTLVLAGGYREAGESGRWRVEAGMLVVHAAGEAHADWFGDRPTELIDFGVGMSLAAGVYRCTDADQLARTLIDRDRTLDEFGNLELVSGEADWPDLLATSLRENPALAIGDWASEHGLRAETVSRGFNQAYGVTPAQYRSGVRVKCAVNSLASGSDSLADVAFRHGFADQPHMTRAVKAAFGSTPAELRAVKSVQEGSFRFA